MKTELVVHDADLETRWWYDDKRQKLSVSREDHDLHGPCAPSSFMSSPCDRRPRSLIRPRSPRSQASRDVLRAEGNTTQRGICEFGTDEQHSSQQRSAVDTSGDVEFALFLDRDVEACWRRVVHRGLLACSARDCN